MFLPNQQSPIFNFVIVTLLFFLGTMEFRFSNLVFTPTKFIQMKAPWDSQRHLINTSGCVLPRTPFLPNGFYMKKDYGPNCDFEKTIVTINDRTETLELTEDGKDNMDGNPASCGAYKIRGFSPILGFRYGRNKFNVTATTSLDISDKELVVTKCGRFVNFCAHFPISKDVRAKINFWKNVEIKKNRPMPISVLFMGFDSTSRSHYQRSLLKTLPLMTKMGFNDFKGYHSVASHTIDNFFSFLMGLNLNRPEETHPCGPKSKSGYDDCPLIWKDFDLNNFVTMYTEDGTQTFRYRTDRSGFFKKPTDYYTQPLFDSIKSLSKTGYANNRTDDQCPSALSSPNFLLDYTKRFLQKFMKIKTPFFSFTWFCYPFHDNTYSLFGLDDKLEEFFQFLYSDESKELRERTLIILNSDHGERFGDFIRKGYYEGFIERVLPGLFIRLPENLLKQFPELNLADTIRINRERLISGFDIHHTLLHLLKLQGLDIFRAGAENTKSIDRFTFNPVLRDRSSLFLRVSGNRTCSDINVPTENCMCMKTTSGLSSTTNKDFQNINPQYFDSLVKFAVKQLNAIVMNTKYSNVCKAHATLNNSFVSWNVFYETDTYTGGVLRFVTNLNKAEFDVQLKVKHGTDIANIVDIQKISSFNRLNSYRNYTWCIYSVSGGDKKMKELCHCKGRRY